LVGTNQHQNELTNTQNELQASRSALKELGIASIELFESVENKNAEKSVDVTVMIATKNRFKLLLRALESINQQSQLPLEIIVVNNGEKFSKKEVAEISRACCSVSRVQFLDGQHLPDLSSLRELGLQKVSTKYAAYLDDDNVMWPRWIENAFKFISKHDLSFVYGSQLREDSDSHYFYQEFSKDKIRETNLIDTNALMHKSDFGRWTPGVSRLSDWSFILNFISDHPEEQITPLPSISTIYKVDAPDRITTSLYSPYKVLIGLLHDLIPDSHLILNSESVYCIICLSVNILGDGPNGRKSASCPNCGSLERYRVLKMLVEIIAEHLRKSGILGKVIEVAPSNVSKRIFSIFGSNYETFDLNPSADGRECDYVADVCKIPISDNSVSLFVALHVLEHVENDRLALREISRVLSSNGICILQVPLAPESQSTQEELIHDDSERIAQYGQIDHVRLYGEDILERIEESGMLAAFISARDILPDFLMNKLGLRDEMKFILLIPNENSLSIIKLEELVRKFQNDYKRLEIFCKLFDRYLG
jgi:SAM-dependent methyltransferase